MKALLKVVAFVFLLFSFGCKTLHFQQAQPAGVANETQFDSTIIGSYVYKEKDKSTTLTITRTQIFLDKDTPFTITATYVLRKYEGMYFVSGLNDDSTWEVYYLKPVKGGVRIGISNSKEEDKLVPKLVAPSHYNIEYTVNNGADSTGKDYSDTTHRYILNPDKEELMKLVKKGGFEETKRLKRVN